MSRPQPPLARPPFFLYGTLLPGERNHPLLDGRTRSWTPAELPGALLFDGPGRPYPYPYALLDPAGGGTVHGEVAEVVPERYDEVLADLDLLEGYVPQGPPDCYERVLLTVRTADGPVEAWAYLAVDGLARDLLRTGTPITDGDWRRRTRPWSP